VDWNKTKTIFIMVFLILDLFLVYQFIEKRNAREFELLAQTSIEELLAEEEISYVDLPKQNQKEHYLIAQSKLFEQEDLKSLENQEVIIEEQSKLVGTFTETIKISEKFQSGEVDKFIKENLLYSKDYSFWSYDEVENTIIYYQIADNKMFYNNSKGKITLFLNDEREIISYEQTYLENIEEFHEEKQLLPALKAIEALYLNGDIPSESTIPDIQLGYYNSLQSLSVSQLLVPAWRIIVDGEKDLFVNAFDGEVIELNTEEKILE